MQSPPLWTKDFMIVSLTNMFIYLVYLLLMVTITVYAIDNLHVSASFGGLASGIFIIGTLIARIFAGWLIERVGRKRTLYIGLISYLAITCLYFVINDIIFLIIIRLIHGAGFGITATATGTIAASIIPDERRGEGTSYYATSTTLAAAFGPSLGICLSNYVSFSIMLIVTILLLAVTLVAVFYLNVPRIEMTAEQLDGMKRFKLDNIFEAKAIPISFITIFIGLGYASILCFLTPYVREIHLIDAGNFFFIVYAATVIVSRPLTGRWFDQKGENFVLYPSFLLFSIGLIMLSQANSAFLLLLAGSFVGLGFGTYLSGAQAISIKVSPPHRFGLATSTFFGFFDIGEGFGPFLLGYVISWFGYSGLYINMAILVLACGLLYYFLHGKKAALRKNSLDLPL